MAAQYPGGATREQIGILTAFKRSTRDTYLQRARQKGLVDQQGEMIIATQEGLDALGADFAPLPTGAALQEYWLARLPEGERKLLELLIDSYPDPVTRDQLGDVTGFKRSTRDTYLQRLGTKRLVTGDRGVVSASEALF